MKTFTKIIEGIVTGKIISDSFKADGKGKFTCPSYQTLHHEQRKALIDALLQENEAVIDLVMSEINCALADAYDAEMRPYEDEDFPVRYAA